MTETLQKWPRRFPVASLLALLFAFAVCPATVCLQARHWTPLQRYYFADYLRSALPGTGKTGKYRLIQMQTPDKPLFALDDWVVPVEPPENAPKDSLPFVLSVVGQQHGGLFLRWEALDKASSPALHSFLENWIYDNRSLTDILLQPFLCAGLASLFFLPFGIVTDVQRTREIRHGRQIRGPELVTRARFNRVMRSSGIGFKTNEPLDLYEYFRDLAKFVRLREADELSHFLIIGDSGAGKSSLIRQMLSQIQLRKQPAIIYDPDCQFIRHFYNAQRGDWVLNPLDERCPYWHPGDEINYAADTVAVASSLYSRDLKEPPFFMDSARDLMAELLKFNPSAAELAHWMAHPVEIDRRIAGTPLESVITHNAQGQRMGVLGTFNKISAALNLLPAETEEVQVNGKREIRQRPKWSANAWAQDRKGWIFVTSTPEAREALRPLHSLWLDTLILRLLGTGQDSEHGVWIVLDELASLQKLPQLHTAITEGRKSKNRIVIGIQGSAQLETLYGQLAVTMLSQPSTKILLRTSEPRAAKWMQDTIGEIEIERFRESRQASYGFGGGKSSKSYSQERKTEPLISAAQISGLPNMKGYLKSGNYVVEMGFPYLHLKTISEGLKRRDVNKIQFRNANDIPPVSQKIVAKPPANPQPTDASALARTAAEPESVESQEGARVVSQNVISKPADPPMPVATTQPPRPEPPVVPRPASSGFISRMTTVDAAKHQQNAAQIRQQELAFVEAAEDNSRALERTALADKQAENKQLNADIERDQDAESTRAQDRLEQQTQHEQSLTQQL